MKTYEIEKLNELYTKADNCDKSVFNEMKSNVKLVAGEHYEKNAHQSRELYLSSSDKAQKVRIVKNLIQKISLGVQDGIMALSPELRVVPFNETELSDRKAAELYDSVLAYGKERYKLEEKKEDWCQDFVDLTEVCVKISFNKEKGDFAGYHQKVKEGLPIYLDSKGQETMAPVSQGYGSMGELIEVPHRPAPDKDRPAFSGDFVFDQIFPADLLRCPTATSMDDSPYLIIRKMMDMEEAKRLVSDDDPERDKKLDSIKKSSEETYRVFDLNTHSFEDSKGKAMIREYYWKPCYDHPNGYYV
jgi:hypothetical protein